MWPLDTCITVSMRPLDTCIMYYTLYSLHVGVIQSLCDLWTRVLQSPCDLNLFLPTGESNKLEANMSLAQRSWNHLCWVHTAGEEIIHSNGRRFTVRNTARADEVTFIRREEVFDSALILGQPPSRIRDGFSIRKMFQGRRD